MGELRKPRRGCGVALSTNRMFSQLSLTGSQARSMSSQVKGTAIVGYNVQWGVDA